MPVLNPSDLTVRRPNSSYIPTLDGWRAVAIVAVMFCHGLDQQTHTYAAPLGAAGVLLFFAISGFLITSRMVEENFLTGRVNLRKFYVRRAFRILPPALVFLATIVVLGLLGVIPFSAGPVLQSLFFVRNYTYFDFSDPATWFSAHFWSLSVEEHFYLIWPTIFLVAGSKRVRWVAPALALALATIVWRMLDEKHRFMEHLFHAPSLRYDWGRTDYLADVLLWGCTLAIWLGRRPWKTPLPRGTTSLLCGATIAFIAFDFFGRGISHGREAVYLFMAVLVGCTVTDPASWLGRFLELAPLRFVGRLSYSLYLWQELFFHADREPLWFQRFPLNVVLIFACACGSYYLVERPLIRVGHRLTPSSAKPSRADDVEPADAVALAV